MTILGLAGVIAGIGIFVHALLVDTPRCACVIRDKLADKAGYYKLKKEMHRAARDARR